MDREIKFRAWLPKEPESEEYIVEYEMCYDLAFEDYEPINDLLNGVNNLMQYTGLIDRYGKEIYEGDILKSLLDDRWFDWLVSFNEGAFIVQNIGVDGYLMDEYRLTSSMAMDRLVIGNIYENPELLKQQEVKK